MSGTQRKPDQPCLQKAEARPRVVVYSIARMALMNESNS